MSAAAAAALAAALLAAACAPAGPPPGTRVQGGPEGASTAAAQALQANPGPLGSAPSASLRAQVLRERTDALEVAAFESPGGAEGLVFVYYPSQGNSALLDVLLYDRSGDRWRRRGRVDGVGGEAPRDVFFGAGAVEVTTTMPRPSDPRCCPTGEARWIVDLATLRGRELWRR